MRMNFFQTFDRSRNFSLEDPEDFARFFEDTHLTVFRYVMALCAGNQVEAEDITADSYFRAWEKRRQFSGTSSAAVGWMITIARNLLIDLRRARGSQTIDSELDDTIPDNGVRIEDLIIDEEQFQDVIKLLPTLPPPQGDILMLRYGLGWQVKSIADHLGWAENTVSVNLRRAAEKLQKQLDRQENQSKKGMK